ncbi:MAG: dTDP-4-dehydrorhamnose 3,5-epimerase [Gammaproteobacteria bacterium]|nr:dTDP-4-dehydrorhamnose 3,5-epimerase [Gammaproteobacteria bacterium]MDH5262875.1 dTDP-4-dehydrorhamnose 3,5-epimerase [Gammaproteobacteria bacterium]
MKFIQTDLPGVICVVPAVHRDERGFLMETWQANRFRDAGIDATFSQDNFSQSSRGTLRGLHYQIQQPQGKLVKVVSGEIFDVAVDLRRSSPHFGAWVGQVLSADNKHQFWIPPGFAHGFLVLSETAAVEYKCTDYYAPEYERSIRWDDPDIGIDWPLENGEVAAMSEKDIAAPFLRDADTYA